MAVNHRDDDAASQIANAIGDPTRACMLYSLLDGRARTSTELAALAEVTASTASVHLHRLEVCHLVKVSPQGKHRYYSLAGTGVANALEALSVLAGARNGAFVPTTPNRLRSARTCYDHMAGTLGVALHDQLSKMGWFEQAKGSYVVTACGMKNLDSLGIEVEAICRLRRRFAYPCLDWSERRPHIGGALGAALLSLTLKKRWVVQELDGRALSVTVLGRREMLARFGVGS